MSGEMKLNEGAAACQMSIRCGNGPAPGYCPGSVAGRGRAALVYIGRSSSALPAAATCCTYRAKCQAMNSSRSEEHTSELQSRFDLVCRLLLEKKKLAGFLQTVPAYPYP